MDQKILLSQIDETSEELLQVLDSFEQELINIVPSEGSWTAGQLAQHLVMSGSGFVEMINGEVKETGRKPDEQVETIKNTFLNFNIKMKSPDFIVPPSATYNKMHLLSSLKDIHKEMDRAIKTLDLSKTCLGFELPMMGFLTRLEAIYFVLYHTQRHMHQLKNIRQKVVKPG